MSRITQMVRRGALLIGLFLIGSTVQVQAVYYDQDTQLAPISGEAGDAAYRVEIYGIDGLRSVTIIENGNVPCAIAVHNSPIRRFSWPNDPGSPYDWDNSNLHEECGRNGSVMEDTAGNEEWTLSIDSASDAYVRGLTICVNANSGRIKGLQLHGGRFEHRRGADEQTFAHQQANCRNNWADTSMCPANTGMVGLRVHYTTRRARLASPIIGLQPICATGHH